MDKTNEMNNKVNNLVENVKKSTDNFIPSIQSFFK